MGDKIVRLEMIRQELGLNKSRFAELMGISAHYYYHILKGEGKNNLRLEHLENLLASNGVSPLWVITGQGSRFVEAGDQYVLPAKLDEEIHKPKIMNDVMHQAKIPAAPGDLNYVLLESVVDKMLRTHADIMGDYKMGITSLSLAWLSMLEFVQELVGQEVDFDYRGRRYKL